MLSYNDGVREPYTVLCTYLTQALVTKDVAMGDLSAQVRIPQLKFDVSQNE